MSAPELVDVVPLLAKLVPPAPLDVVEPVAWPPPPHAKKASGTAARGAMRRNARRERRMARDYANAKRRGELASGAHPW